MLIARLYPLLRLCIIRSGQDSRNLHFNWQQQVVLGPNFEKHYSDLFLLLFFSFPFFSLCVCVSVCIADIQRSVSFRCSDSVIHIFISILFQMISPYGLLSIVPCAIYEVLVVYYFMYSNVYMLIPAPPPCHPSLLLYSH